MNCELMGRFFEVVDLIVAEQKTPRGYDGVVLYHAEVTFIEAVHANPGFNAKELGRTLEITPGAVAQVAAKLLKKGLLECYAAPGSKRERYYRTTPQGERVRASHQEYHRQANEAICAYFCSLSEQEANTLRGFFTTIKEQMPVCEFACRSGGCTAPQSGA